MRFITIQRVKFKKTKKIEFLYIKNMDSFMFILQCPAGHFKDPLVNSNRVSSPVEYFFLVKKKVKCSS